MARKVICPYCGQPAKCVDSSEVYGRSFGWMWICYCVPGAAYVGCRGRTKIPNGTMADSYTRTARKEAKRAFEAMRTKRRMTLQEAYIEVGAELNLAPAQCSISRSDLQQCQRIIAACEKGTR